MAKSPKQTVKTLSDKLSKVNENFQIYMYDNGFMVEVNGRDANDEWATAKIMVNSVDDLIGLIREAVDMERSG